jgi:putative flippase GtrA
VDLHGEVELAAGGTGIALRTTSAQAAKFMTVGVLNTLIDGATYFALTRWLGLTELPTLAKGLSYAAGMTNSFVWNRWWTFRSERNLWGAAALFTLTHVAALGINAGVMSIGLNRLCLPELGGLALATGASFLWNFVVTKLVVFRT